MRKSNILLVLIVLMAALSWRSNICNAGPLDRYGDQPRTNPAADNMLRVPGVVGLPLAEALSSLQQAGLNPRQRQIKTTSASYNGMEGLVVEQTPAAGGIAMLGSSVTIVVYQPPLAYDAIGSINPAPPDEETVVSAPEEPAQAADGNEASDASATPPAGDGLGNRRRPLPRIPEPRQELPAWQGPKGTLKKERSGPVWQRPGRE